MFLPQCIKQLWISAVAKHRH